MSRFVRCNVFLFLGLVSALALLPGSAAGAGFQLIDQSTRGMGYGFAGTATGYGDGSSAFYNPAAMDRLEEPVMTLAGHVVMPSAKFSNQGSFLATTGQPVTGGNGGDGGETALVPNYYYVLPLAEDTRTTLGFALNVPFGLSTSYPDNWVGRYHGQKTELTTVNLNPSLAFEATDWLSIGAGISAMYADAELTQAVDLGAVAGIGSQALDGKSTLTGDDWGYNWNAGLLFTLAEETFVGLAYRSQTELTMDGDVKWAVPAPLQAIQAQGVFINGGGKVDVNLPETAALSASHQLTEAWGLLGELAWTRWSRFDELRVVFDNPGQPDSVVDESWDDVFRLSLGTDYQLDDAWTLRGGLVYDESPVPGPEHRTPRIPDMDRYWLALGLGFNATENVSIDLGYVHIFVEDGKSSAPAANGAVLVGEWSSKVDIVSASITWRM